MHHNSIPLETLGFVRRREDDGAPPPLLRRAALRRPSKSRGELARLGAPPSTQFEGVSDIALDETPLAITLIFLLDGPFQLRKTRPLAHGPRLRRATRPQVGHIFERPQLVGQ